MSYTIGELAKKFGIATSTLRYYEKEGLLPYVKRKTSGVREYEIKDCENLLLIDCLKQCGMSIKEISNFVDLLRCGAKTLREREELLRTLAQSAKEKLKQQKMHVKRLEYEAWLHEKALEQGSLEVVSALPSASIPKKFRKTRKKMEKLLNETIAEES